MIVGRKRAFGGWLGPPALFVGPALVLFGVLFAIPAVSSLYVSLCNRLGSPWLSYSVRTTSPSG